MFQPGPYTVTALKEGFETAIVENFEPEDGPGGSLVLTLKPAASKQTIEVHEMVSAAEAPAAPSATVRRGRGCETTPRPSTVADTLRLIPAIARQPTGQLQLSGSREHRSTMMVNSAVIDPATGGFGFTLTP